MLKIATKFAPVRPGFEMALAAGFHHAELYLDESILGRWQEVADLAGDYPLRYALHFPNRLKLAPELLQATVALYRRLDCTALVIHQAMFDHFQEQVLAREPHLRLAIENHKLDRAGFWDWAARGVGLTLDVEHLWKFTLPDAPLAEVLALLKQFLQQHASKLHHVHLLGYWPGFEEHRPLYCSRDLVFPVLSLLQEFGHQGLVVSEIDTPYQTPNDLRMDVLLFELWRQNHSRANEFLLASTQKEG